MVRSLYINARASWISCYISWDRQLDTVYKLELASWDEHDKLGELGQAGSPSAP